jgi:hypothetical protein
MMPPRKDRLTVTVTAAGAYNYGEKSVREENENVIV